MIRLQLVEGHIQGFGDTPQGVAASGFAPHFELGVERGRNASPGADIKPTHLAFLAPSLQVAGRTNGIEDMRAVPCGHANGLLTPRDAALAYFAISGTSYNS